MSRRQAFPTRGRWLATLLCAFFFFFSSTIPCCRAFSSMTWTSTCSLDGVPVESVPTAWPPGGGGRRLLGPPGPAKRDAAAPPEDRAAVGLRRRSEEDEEGPAAAHLEGRRCACALAYDDAAHYCPLPADRCSVVRQRYGRSVRVECFRRGNWMVGFARHVWYYLCFILLLLGLYLSCSMTGQHAIRFLLSKCFPRMNPWIVGHILRTELEARDLIRDDFEHFASLERRTEGWISGYRIRTRRYSENDEGAAAGDGDGRRDSPKRGEENAREGAGEGGPTGPGDEEEGTVCTICIAAVQDGDRVADLGCGHLFHAECLSEWIVKKNSCPLCQGPVAEEIRSFEAGAQGAGTGGEGVSEGALTRWRRRAWDGVLDVATGRDRQMHMSHRARLRNMLNESANATANSSDESVE